MATNATSTLGDSDAMPAARPAPLLPPLREDIDLHPASRMADGSPSWMLQDRARNRFFRIGWIEFEIIRRWGLREADRIVDSVNRETAARIDPDDVSDMTAFLASNGLLMMTGAAGRRAWQARLASGDSHWTAWLLKNYLFIRIHLLRPDSLLRALLPAARPFMTRSALTWTLILALIGCLLVFRQWDAFIASAPQFTTPEGAALYGGAIVFAKILHELGHALTAARYGLRVPSMGIALMVLWPVLYTDTSEAWKLTDRRARLQIGAAGMTAELMLAVAALYLWLLLPPGQLRGAVFALAAVTWIATLAVNLNPFMRFDGYYLLADGLGVDNLQDRSFALARWRLRRFLFGLREPPPEIFSGRVATILTLYAWGTWIYRLVLFIGIAVLVYYIAFKALGILLMVTEIAFFVMLPILREMKRWWERRSLFRPTANIAVTLSVLVGIGIALAVPWKTSIEAPAILQAQRSQAIYPPFGARIERVAVRAGEKVSAGAPLFDMSAPDIEEARRTAERRAFQLGLQIQRERTEAQLRERGGILREQLAEALAEQEGNRRELARLKISAPFDASVADLGIGLQPGRWVGPKDRLALLVSGGNAVVEAYLEAGDLARVATGTPGRFYAEGEIGPPLAVTVQSIDTAATARLERPYLASRYDGPIDVRVDRKGALQPEIPVYRMILTADREIGPPVRERRGRVVLDGPPQRLIDRAWRAVAAILIRESGF